MVPEAAVACLGQSGKLEYGESAQIRKTEEVGESKREK